MLQLAAIIPCSAAHGIVCFLQPGYSRNRRHTSLWDPGSDTDITMFCRHRTMSAQERALNMVETQKLIEFLVQLLLLLKTFISQHLNRIP